MTEFKQFFKFLSFLLIGVSSFFTAYTLIPMSKDLPMPICISSACVILFYTASKSIIYIENKFKNVIKNLFGHLYDTADDIKEEKQLEHELLRGKLIKETIENVG